MGYAAERFTADPAILKAFLCALCDNVIRNAHSACSNDHVFCLSCLKTWDSNNCPTCGQITVAWRHHGWLQRTIQELERKCRYRDCDFVGTVKDWREHMDDSASYQEGCRYRTYTCPHCSEQMQARHVSKHLKEECPETVIKCQFGGYGCPSQMQRKAINKHLAHSCRFIPCRLEYDLSPAFGEEFVYGCDFVGTWNEKSQHTHCQDLVDAIYRCVDRLKADASEKQEDNQSEGADRAESPEMPMAEQLLLEQLQQENQALKAENESLKFQLAALHAAIGTELEVENSALLQSTTKNNIKDEQADLRTSKRPRRSCVRAK